MDYQCCSISINPRTGYSMNPVDILLAAWAVFWGLSFAYSVRIRPSGWFDTCALLSLLSLAVFPVLCVHVDRLVR